MDQCGILGKVHTSTTLGSPEGALSSLMYHEGILNVYPFDFKDALCPPESMTKSHTYSFIGKTGYNP